MSEVVGNVSEPLERQGGMSRASITPVLVMGRPAGQVAGVVFATGAAISGILFVIGVSPGIVLIPTSLALLLALAVVPFPQADRWLALALIATFPLLPPIGVPNLPVGSGVLLIALVRVAMEDRVRPSRATIITLTVLWSSLAIGVLLSHWPPISVWARPAFILSTGALSSFLGVLVWRDQARRERWLDGIALGAIVVTTSALLFFAMQYVRTIGSIVDDIVFAVAHVRGESAGAKFDSANNWLIVGDGVTLRAVSPLFPSPNNLGGYLGLLLPLIAVRWLTATEGRWRFIAGAAVALGVATMLVTFSRSTWLATGVAGVVGLTSVLVFRLWRTVGWPSRARLVRAVSVVLLAAALGSLGVITTGHQASEDRLTNPLEDVSVTTRIEINGEAIAAVASDPLRGAGIGNWEAALAERSGRAYVHDVYLEYASAAGLFGLAWSLLIILIPLGAAFVVMRGDQAAARLAGLALVVSVTFAAVQFLFDDNLLNPQYVWLHLWMVGGSLGLLEHRLRG